MKKVVHLTSAHPPFDKRIFVKECRSLAQAGYEVVFIAPHERDEQVDGVTIRHFLPPKNRRERFLRSAWRAFRFALKEQGDLYHFHDPDLLFTGLLLKLAGKRVVYDPHEDHPADFLGKEWLPALLRRPLSLCVRMMEAIGGLCFDAIIPATPPIARRFPKRKTTVVQNFPRLEEFDQERPEGRNPSREHAILSAGIISGNRGIFQTLEAFAFLKKDFPELRLLLAGDFLYPEEELHIRSHPVWSEATYLGWISREEVARLMRSSVCGLVLFHPGPNHTESYPTKLFEFMASGLPLVASNFPLWKSIVEESECGVTVDPQDAESVACGVRSLLEDPESARRMGENGRRAARTTFNWEREAFKLLEAYRRVLE